MRTKSPKHNAFHQQLLPGLLSRALLPILHILSAPFSGELNKKLRGRKTLVWKNYRLMPPLQALNKDLQSDQRRSLVMGPEPATMVCGQGPSKGSCLVSFISTPSLSKVCRSPLTRNHVAFSSDFFALEPRSLGSGSSFFGRCD